MQNLLVTMSTMNKITITIATFLFNVTAFASYQPCVQNADFCVKFVNESSSPATVKSLSNVDFVMPGVSGLVEGMPGTDLARI